ncbi:uncharacterized protein LOC141915296 [Tubulanus polymorphus]|uniref:uncharacterized protein LOC141915296 n=1 Tax=Tubulanus polymorphus TaxID=672921 RepID=UPI003DA25CDD
MPRYCCVPLCKSRVGGFKFPTNTDLKMKWLVAIKLQSSEKSAKLWQPSDTAIVCHRHFLPTDYKQTLTGSRRKLKENAIPRIFAFTPPVSSDSERESRASRRRLKLEEEPVHHDIATEVEIGLQHTSNYRMDIIEEPTNKNTNLDKNIQCSLLSDQFFCIERFMVDPRSIKYYTSFKDYEHLMMFFSVLGPAAYDLNYKCQKLTPVNQFFLTLIKLRRAKEDIELSILFGISESVVSRIVLTWVNFMYFQLSEINTWPEREEIDCFMPSGFKHHFPSTRVILDATEIPIEKPSNVKSQTATFSTCKHKNTLKTMVGISPRGVVSYVSESYAGSTSDRQIIERSQLCSNTSKYFSSNDSIMADRGIMVQDLFATKNIKVNTPTLLKGKSQLEPEQVVHDRRVASKRIQVERVIGLSKTFLILKKDLPLSKVNMGSRIVYVCFSISNFRPAIVNEFA